MIVENNWILGSFLEFDIIAADFADGFIEIGRIEVEDMCFDVIVKAFYAVSPDGLNATIPA